MEALQEGYSQVFINKRNPASTPSPPHPGTVPPTGTGGGGVVQGGEREMLPTRCEGIGKHMYPPPHMYPPHMLPTRCAGIGRHAPKYSRDKTFHLCP